MSKERNKKPLPASIPPFDIAIMDLDTLPYIFGWTHEDVEMGMRAIDGWLISVMDYLKVSESVGFIKGVDNFRLINDPNYKSKRKDSIAPDIRARIDRLYEYLMEIATESVDAEADDYCSIQMYQELSDGKNPVVVHVDKDLNQIPGWHYNPKKNDAYFVLPEEGYTVMIKQLLSGDYTDGVVGIPGRGPAWAEKVFMEYQRELSGILEFVYSVYRRELKGNAQAAFVNTANHIFIRTNLEDLRWLTFDELMDRLKWDGDDKVCYWPKQQSGIRQLLIESVEIPHKSATVEHKWNQEKDIERLGNVGVRLLSPTTKIPLASSTRSHVSQRVKDTSGKSRFTSIVERSAYARVAGAITRGAVRK
jgi:5'-3' exonuclease